MRGPCGSPAGCGATREWATPTCRALAGETYREEIRRLDSLATPAPWATDGELYGVHESGSFMPLGFA
jgi:hypothetical protein